MTTDARALIRLTPDETAQLRHHIADHKVTCSYSCHLIEHLLTGYSEALDAVERVKMAARDQAGRDRALIGALENYIDQKPSRETLLDEAVQLRTELGELKLVIEQQDRDLTASRAINRHFEQERDSWGEAHKQRAAQTDKRIGELEGEMERMRSFIQLSASPSGKIFRDDLPELFRESDGNALYVDEARIRLLELGAPCTTK